jgi:hypothetical protein
MWLTFENCDPDPSKTEEKIPKTGNGTMFLVERYVISELLKSFGDHGWRKK